MVYKFDCKESGVYKIKKQNQHGQIVYQGIKVNGINSFTVDY